MKIIITKFNQLIYISDQDWKRVRMHTWHVERSKHTYYAKTNVKKPDGKFRPVKMHRFIANAPAGIQVDHRNGNGLDNQRRNLRKCTNGQNRRNQRRLGKNCSSGFKGVSFRAQRGVWIANATRDGKQFYLGQAKTAKEAAMIYDRKILKIHGSFACTNKQIGAL